MSLRIAGYGWSSCPKWAICARECKFICEIALKGFEPHPNKQGEIVSNISNVRVSEGKFIFYYCELAGERGGEVNRCFTADTAEVMRNLVSQNVKTKI